MLWGLAGASGTGKTTLGQAVAEAMGIAFVKTSITDMAKKHGFDAISNLALPDRLILQEHLLQEMMNLIQTCERPAILDRTPIDLIGYMMGEVSMHSRNKITEAQSRQIEDYVRRCQLLGSQLLDHTFITSPLPFYEEVDTRPGFNPAYQAHVHLLVSGAVLSSPFRTQYTILRTPDFQKRLEVTVDLIQQRMNSLERLKKTSKHIH